jgi:hypothetical protein
MALFWGTYFSLHSENRGLNGVVSHFSCKMYRLCTIHSAFLGRVSTSLHMVFKRGLTLSRWRKAGFIRGEISWDVNDLTGIWELGFCFYFSLLSDKRSVIFN